MAEKTKRAPNGLGLAGRRLWAQIVGEFSLEPQDWARLEAACRQMDVAANARNEIATAGEYLTDRHGRCYAHPALAVERSAQTIVLRALREMGLDVAAVGDLGRPPSIAGRAGLRLG